MLAHHSSMTCVQFFCGSVPSPMACRQTSKRRFSTLALTKAIETSPDFFWLSNPEDPESEFQVYRFKTVLFRSTSSPFMLNATLHHHLANYNTPVAEDMKENICVDNAISGCNEEQDAVDYYGEARSIMKEAHFNLRSWSSNSPLLREQAARDGIADTKEIVNILGLKWNTFSDTLSLTPQKPYQPSDQPITKRCVLQSSSKTYDPLGLMSPVTIRNKLSHKLSAFTGPQNQMAQYCRRFSRGKQDYPTKMLLHRI